ncbi:MAG: UDP-N-acetylmuramoyl-L-alanyl-D-glutamate--2,6-diaminopimelate ligase [Alphaproteobacteria bacterium GM202ARS2]|nr:UDP-N-acetylmuramoyl-L-alanyl-D-glutamate--2,6-diaminopimelate ligase [Alphaproteobacteria bacterium GM202ARS2]
MELSELMRQVGLSENVVDGDMPKKPCVLQGLTCDSRAIQPGFLFVACAGSHAHGDMYITDAVARGALAIMLERASTMDKAQLGVVVLRVDNPRRYYALMCAAWFGYRQPSTLAAVTGTNGKTSVADFVAQLWRHAGVQEAHWGTLDVLRQGTHHATLTTPDAYDVHRRLAHAQEEGATHAVLEASSHGLAQHRLDGARVDIAAMTNMSRDHLDYHGDMDSYVAAKRRLFTDVLVDDKKRAVAVLNHDDDCYERMREAVVARGLTVMTYGRHEESTIRLCDVREDEEGQAFRVRVHSQEHTVRVSLVGEFQVMNVLCALSVVLASGIEQSRVLAGLPHLQGVVGRMQRVARLKSGDGGVYVDYAHTPDGLARALKALRGRKGMVFVVFGCGGERDQGKRAMMGSVAAQYADGVVVTDDNPRGEDAEIIRKQIVEGIKGDVQLVSYGDRGQAIRYAMNQLARVGSGSVLVAGKGHERGQIVGTQVVPFDDTEVVREVCRTDAQHWEVVS